MPAGHDLLHLSALGVLLGTGAPFLTLAWRRRSGRRRAGAHPSPSDAARATRIALSAIVVATLIGAGIIHAAASLEHDGLEALCFIVIAAVQVGGGLLWIARPDRRLALVMSAVALGTIVVWAASRSVGVPLLPEQPESIGRPDLIASLLEAATVVALELWLALERPGRRISARLGAVAAILPVPIVGIGLLATLLAFAPLGAQYPNDHGGTNIGLHQH